MKTAVVAISVALVACSHKPRDACPSIERLEHRDAAADARTALARGDTHLLSLGGFAGTTPGADDATTNATNSVEIEGTSDTTTDACRRLGNVAEAYATKYNQTIVASPTR